MPRSVHCPLNAWQRFLVTSTTFHVLYEICRKIFTTKILSTELFIVLFTEMEFALGKEKFYPTWNRYSSSKYHFAALTA